MRLRSILCTLLMFFPLGSFVSNVQAVSGPVTYYVSSSSGNDSWDGLTQATALKTVSKVNSLNLQPGDQILFKCGDTWRADPLLITKSGNSGSPIVINSYPTGCQNKPVMSGSKPIGGWSVYSGNIYQSDLPAADFPLGINQLFRDGQRLTLGRWPNLDSGNGGYSFVDGHTANSDTITDLQLPAGNWTGAIVHIKNIRWSMLDRKVLSSNGTTLKLNQGLSCLISSWSDCVGWGFFINNSLNTLDQDGEWFYDQNYHRAYLYSKSGAPVNVEGSAVLSTDLNQGGVMLSSGGATSYVILDNLEIKNWYNHGIGTPGSMTGDIYHHITVRNVTIRDVDGAGVNLSSWLERPPDGVKGLRGGHHLVFTNNVIDGANSFGISGFFAQSTFEDNSIQNITLVKNLGKSGMGCGLNSNECTENGDGFRIRLFDLAHSGFGNILRYNRFEKIGYNGVDVFGPDNIIEDNFITQSCYTKADCGAVRVFGDNNLSSTTVFNIHLINNVIVDIPGNVDGCHPSRAAFGMGLYIDNFSRDVEVRGNTIVDTSISGILYQRSTGVITGNTVFNASYGNEYSGQIDLGGSETRVSMSNNMLYGLNLEAWTLYDYSLSNILSSDSNYFFHPYVNQHIAYGSTWTRKSFAQWQAFSGKDIHSKTNWFTQPNGEASRGKIFYNSTKTGLMIDLGNRQYLDLDQKPVIGSLTLQPFTSRILVDNGPAPLGLAFISPSLFDVDQAADFTMDVVGTGFTANSLVRWNGSDRSTTRISSTHLRAMILSTDVNTIGDYPVTVFDTVLGETSPLQFHVPPEVYGLFLPQTLR